MLGEITIMTSILTQLKNLFITLTVLTLQKLPCLNIINLNPSLLFNLSPDVQFVKELNGVELFILREDQIHSEISGNKWRKLKYYYDDFLKSGKSKILSFGGAYSNHLAAMSALAREIEVESIALIRGEEPKTNDTLDYCLKNGMILKSISRENYKLKDSVEFLKNLSVEYPDCYIIPEGGKGVLGIQGCTEIMDNLDKSFDIVCIAAGTGTTATGLIYSSYRKDLEVYPALKGEGYLAAEIKEYQKDYSSYLSTEGRGKVLEPSSYKVIEDYHFGGYGKCPAELVSFMNEFYKETSIPLDPIYTSKLLFGVIDRIKKSFYPKGSKVLAIHTGGLQGIKGMNHRLEKNNLYIEYEV